MGFTVNVLGSPPEICNSEIKGDFSGFILVLDGSAFCMRELAAHNSIILSVAAKTCTMVEFQKYSSSFVASTFSISLEF